METYTGRRVDFANPDPGTICIEDIAHALARLCRYGGHCRTSGIWSVAQHCLAVEGYLRDRGPRIRLLALLHDAPEAYLHDLPPMMKSLLPEYRKWEQCMELAVWETFGLAPPTAEEVRIVKYADTVGLATEAALLMCSGGEGWAISADPSPDMLISPEGLDPAEAEEEYIVHVAHAMRELARE